MKLSAVLKNHIVRILLATAVVLLVPLVAMQFSDDVDWDLRDFVTIGVLLISAGLIYEFMTTKLNKKYRPAVAIAIAVVVLLIWAELAVGIFGTPFAGS
jgi:hypothetical protein